jgi:hypothetical protein
MNIWPQIFPFQPSDRAWLDSKGKCSHCHHLYSASPCGPGGGVGSNDHYWTCIDLAYQYLAEQATEDELNEPQEEIAYV